MFCSKCGAQSNDDNIFCSKCSAPIAAAVADTRPAAENPAKFTATGKAPKLQKKKTHTKRNLIIVCLSLLLLAGSAVAAGFVWTIPGWTWMNTGTRLAEKQLTLGKKYQSESKYEEAVLAFEKVIKIDAKNKDAYLGLADAYVGLEKLDKAEETLEDGIDKLPEEEDFYIILADIYIDKDNTDSAIATLEAGYEKTGSSAIETRLTKGLLEFNVLSDSMSPTIKSGDTIYCKPFNGNEILVGDIIVYKQIQNFDIYNDTARVIEKFVQNNKIYYKTKGDNTPTPNMTFVSDEEIVGIFYMVKNK